MSTGWRGERQTAARMKMQEEGRVERNRSRSHALPERRELTFCEAGDASEDRSSVARHTNGGFDA